MALLSTRAGYTDAVTVPEQSGCGIGGGRWVYCVMFEFTNPASCHGAIHLSTMCGPDWWQHVVRMMMMETVGFHEPRVLALRSSRCLTRPGLSLWIAVVPTGSKERGCAYWMQTAKAKCRAPPGCPARMPRGVCTTRVLPTSTYSHDRDIRALASYPCQF